MSTQVRITLHDEVYRRAKRLAQISNRNVEDLLAQAIELSLSPVGATVDNYKPVSKLSDGEVLELSEMQDAKQDRRFSRLLNKQQAGKLSNSEESELLARMQSYQEKLLRKAQALREAVRRGLREPLTP